MRLIYPLLFAAFAAPALAESDFVRPVDDPLTLEECSACHMAYSPVFLPKASWNAIMDDLSNHFGEDASLGEEATVQIRAYLTGAAPDGVRGVDNANPVLRISELGWFKREHGRAFDRAASDPKIGSISNCAACHSGAEKGWFEDD